jgi:hypothetical protein
MLVLVTLWAFQAPEATAQTSSMLERGWAIGRDDERPHAIVTPFRELHTRYPIEMLIDAQKTGVISGHDEMPMFELSREDMRALLAYIDSFAPGSRRYVRP